MEKSLQSAFFQQFISSVDMLENALQACPADLWRVRLWDEPRLPGASEFWYIVFHTLFWLDLYLSGAVEGFTPPPPFNLDELDPKGIIPEKPYSRDELLAYLEHCRAKCRTTIDNLTDEQAASVCTFPWGQLSFAGLLLDNMRHVQEHTAQLNLILGQNIGWSPHWVTRAEKPGI